MRMTASDMCCTTVSHFLSSFPQDICILMYALSTGTFSCHKIVTTNVCTSSCLESGFAYMLLFDSVTPREGFYVKGACFREANGFVQSYMGNTCNAGDLNLGSMFQKAGSFQVLSWIKGPPEGHTVKITDKETRSHVWKIVLPNIFCNLSQILMFLICSQKNPT